ncbi:MAG: UMP kinase, partial [Treponemataceae bacterium]|nr:UMP kinase [Treponemataceae bacterium]
MSTKILSVGGSIVAPEQPDVDFIRRFVAMAKAYLAAHPGDRLILVVGGGGPARIYQQAFRDAAETDAADDGNAAD